MMELTYAERVRKAMRAKDMTRRDLQRATCRGGEQGYSYEHIRKIVGGLPMMSEKFNEDICAVLGLDAGEMWNVALGEKHKRVGRLVMPDNRFLSVWDLLESDDHERILKIAEGLAEQRKLEREDRDLDTPDKLTRKLVDLSNRLSAMLTSDPSSAARSQ